MGGSIGGGGKSSGAMPNPVTGGPGAMTPGAPSLSKGLGNGQSGPMASGAYSGGGAAPGMMHTMPNPLGNGASMGAGSSMPAMGSSMGTMGWQNGQQSLPNTPQAQQSAQMAYAGGNPNFRETGGFNPAQTTAGGMMGSAGGPPPDMSSLVGAQGTPGAYAARQQAEQAMGGAGNVNSAINSYGQNQQANINAAQSAYGRVRAPGSPGLLSGGGGGAARPAANAMLAQLLQSRNARPM